MAQPRKRPSSKKGPTVGSGGQRRRGLEGKGPTPPARMRPGHPAERRAAAAEKRAAVAAKRARAEADAPETVAGRNAVVEALRARVPAGALYVATGIDADERVREAVKLAGDRGIAIVETGRVELDRLSGRALHQGVALQVPPYSYHHADDVLARAQESTTEPLLVALDGVTDPRNLGAVIRSAAAFGAHGVLLPERRSAGVTAAAWKTSAGAAARLPVARVTNLTRALKDCARAGLMVVGLAADGDLDVGELELATGPLALVVGSEGRGLSRLVGETCDLRVRIPMASGVESLNAGVAAGVALYEVARRRASAGPSR
ncbi:MAG: 23S rRNA (guanosine(2251)-2'-O)-methyltransferase RlmB [Frankiaceae bacterium]